MVANIFTFSYGTSIPNLNFNETIAFGDLAALMMRRLAKDPLEYVATSFVTAHLAVVVKSVTFFPQQKRNVIVRTGITCLPDMRA